MYSILMKCNIRAEENDSENFSGYVIQLRSVYYVFVVIDGVTEEHKRDVAQ